MEKVTIQKDGYRITKVEPEKYFDKFIINSKGDCNDGDTYTKRK